jgi:hypothetical protein
MAILRERTLSTALFVKLPVQDPLDRGFKECCYEHVVLADTETDDPEKNDYTTFYFVKQTPADDVTWVLIEEDLTEHNIVDNTFGELVDFGDFSGNELLSYLTVDWKKVLLALGPQVYQIRSEQSVGGLSIDILSNSYTLRPFNFSNANYTVRWDIEMSGYIKRLNVDFGTGVMKHSMRFRGFFGNNDPEWEFRESIHKDRNRNHDNYISINSKWVLQGIGIPVCISKELVNFFTLATDHFLSDYNANNHDYELSLIPVKFTGSDGIDYNNQSRDAKINFTFGDRYLDNEKFS